MQYHIYFTFFGLRNEDSTLKEEEKFLTQSKEDQILRVVNGGSYVQG